MQNSFLFLRYWFCLVQFEKGGMLIFVSECVQMHQRIWVYLFCVCVFALASSWL